MKSRFRYRIVMDGHGQFFLERRRRRVFLEWLDNPWFALQDNNLWWHRNFSTWATDDLREITRVLHRWQEFDIQQEMERRRNTETTVIYEEKP